MPRHGTLVISIPVGNMPNIPNTLTAQISVFCPNGDILSENLTGGSNVYLDLRPGKYTIKSSKPSPSPNIYIYPEQEKYQTWLTAGQTLTQTIHYIWTPTAHTTGTLIINIVGLPNSLTAQVKAIHPHGEPTSTENIAGGTNRVLGGLTTGNYTLQPLDVGLWKPEQGSYQVLVGPGSLTQKIVYHQTATP
jgi:hypothetical protein